MADNSPVEFEMRECTRPECGFRFPVGRDDPLGARCPRCGAAAHRHGIPFGAAVSPPKVAPPTVAVIHALLDNLRSAWNVGSIFRSADGAGLQHLYLCGTTPPPPHAGIHKTALGAEESVPWSYAPNALWQARNLQARGYRLWALEATLQAQSLFTARTELPNAPLVLIVGNERSGVDPEILALCERSVWIPMLGVKESLNVAIAFGIAAYTLRFG
ncbi:MAG: hypothetical protein OHK0052_06360 [Anaerolineales bacterium]